MSVQILTPPTTCPRCGHATIIKTEPASGVKTLWCTNANCGARNTAKWEHFVSRDAMNIAGISTAVLQDMLDLGIIDDRFASIYEADFQDIFRLCTDIDGYGEKKVSNIIDAITASKKTTLERVIYALGIPNVGLQTAKLIVQIADWNVDTLCDPIIINKIMNTKGLGSAVANSYQDFMINNGDQLIDLLDHVTLEEHKQITGELTGLTFCCTGAVAIYANRKELQASIEGRGGKFTTSVTGNTSYLITNDTTSGSAKNKAAQKLNIPIISEQQFIDQFGK